ncbi:ABC transporter ATP-binding protein [Desertibaculum subflavum]|uniref:ABC transporter ATP-binding protein n=1 Tax=Desertibaculum subflavum TaxID=2268458 RepID=UPI000E6732F7
MLTLAGIAKRFGGIEALTGIDLAVPAGSLLGLIGPNGSGKTTLLNVVSGFTAPDAGEVRIGATEVTGWPPHRIARLGVGRTLQHPRVFSRLTVLDNIRGDSRLSAGEAEALLDRFGLSAQRGRLGDELTIGELRRLDLARAVARDPRLLLLDEPAGGLTPSETSAMADLLSREVLPGRTGILIEHKMDLIAALCPCVVVLDFGRRIAEGAPSEVLRRPEVVEAYFGTEGADA